MDENSEREDDAMGQSDPLADLLAQGLPSQPGGAADGAPDDTVPPASSADAWPLRIPGYELLREIGRGGMGCVYLATQLSTRRRVAIKVMAAGPLESDKARRRFAHEAEILAQLNHPNIVTIHDSGVVSGVSYYVMDYIPGQRLDDWLAGAPRPVDECLRLFAQICAAVAAAHLRGVMHRDLKPANILVDGESRPHVLDFGLAKLAGDEHDGAQPSIMTLTGQFMGTVPWASPEQAEAIPGLIDLRTDVYSLGVILYQMLTGRLPYDVSGTMREVLDRIVAADPIRPSRVRRQINDEVETIILKCLEKEPARRYQSAGELARDVERYLAGEPIEAKRQSFGYLLRKQLHRHQLAVSAGACFVLVVCAGLVSSTVFWRQAVAQRDRLHDETCLRRVAQAQHAYDQRKFDWMRQLLFSCPPTLRGWEWYYLVAQSDRSEHTFFGHTRWAKAVAFADGGRLIASVGHDGRLFIWDTQDGRVRLSNSMPEISFDDMAFSPRATWTAATGTSAEHPNRVVCVWDSDTQEGHSDLSSAACGSGALVFLNERTFAVATADGVELWDVELTPRALVKDTQPITMVVCLAVNHNRSRVVAGGKTGETPQTGALRMWDIDPHDPTVWYAVELENGIDLVICPDPIDALAFSPNDQTIAVTTGRGRLLCVDASTGRTLAGPLSAVDGQARAVAWNADGRHVAVAGDDQAIRVLDAQDLDQDPNLLIGHYAPVNSLAFHPTDSNTLASCSDDSTVKLWRIPVAEDPVRLRMESEEAVALAFGPDGRRLALGGRHGKVELWTRDGGKWRLASFLEDFTGGSRAEGDRLRDTQFSPDGRFLAAAGVRDPQYAEAQATVYVWDAGSGEVLLRLRADAVCTRSLAFSPDSRWLATTGTDCWVRLWDMRQAIDGILSSPAREIDGHAVGPLLSVAFSPDGRQLVWGTDRPESALWCFPFRQDDIGAEPDPIHADHTLAIRAVAFAKQGALLVTGSDDCTVRVSNAGTGRLVRSLHRGHRSILDVAVSADGRRVAGCGWDHTVRIWDIETSVQVAMLAEPRGGAQRVAFSPDGCRLACVDGEGTVWLWQAATLEEIHRSPRVGLALAESATEMMADGQYDDARDLFAEAVEILQNTLLPDNPRRRQAVELYVAACEEAKQPDEASRWRPLLDARPDLPWEPREPAMSNDR